MIYALRTRMSRAIFDSRIDGIVRTPPIAYKPAPWMILSMVSHADLRMYLLAIKSFYAQLAGGKILVIDDGSLTPVDKAQLGAHLVSPDIISREAISIGRFPRHIMWERLACALDLSDREYVVQLDADTITLGPLDDVRKCILENRAFTLGTWWHGREHLSAKQAAEITRLSDSQDHIQVQLERALGDLPGADTLKYIRGSAGLVGLAKDSSLRAAVEDLSVAMTAKFGPRFLEWGTDQFAFNFAVANSEGSVVLPYPAYACFGPETSVDKETRFLHFIGTYRFTRGLYARQGRHFIAQFSDKGHPEAIARLARR